MKESKNERRGRERKRNARVLVRAEWFPIC